MNNEKICPVYSASDNTARKSRSTETYHRITYQPLAQRNIKTRTLEYYLQNSVQR